MRHARKLIIAFLMVKTMVKPILYTVVQSRFHPRLTDFYTEQGFEEKVFTSTRKVMSALKKESPAYLVADFIYGYSNNYAGVNISNLDVMLMAMQRYSPDTKVIVLAQKQEVQYVDKLNDIFPLLHILTLPVTARDMLGLL